MKHIIIFIFFLLSLSACDKSQDPTNLNETFYVRNDGADMPVYMHGNINSKTIILIVHGGPGGSSLDYRGGMWSAELEKKYAIAYWDQRGQGMSQGQYDDSKLTVAKMAEDMDAVVSSLKAKFGTDIGIFAYGHSWGGTLSAKYLTTGNLQKNLKGWIESDGAHDLPKNNIEAVKLFRKVSAEQIALGNNVDNWQDIKTWAEGIDLNNIDETENSEINSNAFKVEEWLTEDGVLGEMESGGITSSTFFGPINPITSKRVGNYTNGVITPEIDKTALTNELYKITIPVLALWGKYDFVVAPTLGFDTFNKVSSKVKKLVIFEKSGHSPMNNEWSKYTSEIILFVDANK